MHKLLKSSSAKPSCPHCFQIELRRQARYGFWQMQFMTRLGYYPWECGQCRTIYYVRQRSFGYRQHSRTESRSEPIVRQASAG